MEIIDIGKLLLSSLTVFAQACIVVAIMAILLRGKYPFFAKISRLFGQNGLLFSFIIALTSMLGSLFFSEIAKLIPCELCWFQRILMYPLVIIFGIAYVKRDLKIYTYTTPIVVLGAIIALYHYLLQIGIVPKIIPCSAVGYSVDCAKIFIMNFGYTTIPLMALSAFALMILIRFSSKS